MTAESQSRLGKLVSGVDRFFPILWIGLYLLLPTSGWAPEMLRSWYDQQLYLEALRSLLSHRSANAIDDNVVGPAFVGAAALIHDVFRLSPEDSLVALARGSFAISVAFGLILVRVLTTRLVAIPPLATLMAQVCLVALVLVSGTWFWSDVPWSHFLATCLALAVFVARFVPRRRTLPLALVLGVPLALLAATRTFELLVLGLAWVAAEVCFIALRLSRPSYLQAGHLLASCGSFIVTTIAVYALTGKHDLFWLYAGNLDAQMPSLGGGVVTDLPAFSPAFIPVKLIQLFVDPCYFSLCSTSDYGVGGGVLWTRPLLVQLPALATLPLCLVGVLMLTTRCVRRRPATHAVREARALAEMTIAAIGLVLGYAASTIAGPSHLRYGFARDFLLAASLTGVAVTVLAAALLWKVVERRRRAAVLSPESMFVVGALAAIALAIGMTALAHARGLPRFESRHLGSVTYSTGCAGRSCNVSLAATNEAGERVAIPPPSRLTFSCAQNGSSLTVFASSLSRVELPQSCTRPMLTAAWPTVMGLPATERELRAVRVSNGRKSP